MTVGFSTTIALPVEGPASIATKELCVQHRWPDPVEGNGDFDGAAQSLENLINDRKRRGRKGAFSRIFAGLVAPPANVMTVMRTRQRHGF